MLADFAASFSPSFERLADFADFADFARNFRVRGFSAFASILFEQLLPQNQNNLDMKKECSVWGTPF